MLDHLLTIVSLDSNATNIKLHDFSVISILHDHPTAPPRTQTWNYRSTIVCLLYIQAIIPPDITITVQQCARFCNQPNKDQEEAVKCICCYLLKTHSQDLFLKPDRCKGLECHIDADFSGTWTHLSAGDPLSYHSRTGFFISYAGYPVLWKSKCQSLVTLSTTETEYIALYSFLCEVIALVQLLDDL